MLRYPDEIIIQKVVGNENDPYNAPVYETIYRGRCRWFLNKPAAFRNNKVADCDYKIVIPDRTMIAVGENFRIGVKYHNSPNKGYWDLVGYCKDFARYERVCEVYMQLSKENIIYEDIPAKSDEVIRTVGIFENDYVRIEAINFDGDVFQFDYPITIWLKPGATESLEFGWYHPESGIWEGQGVHPLPINLMGTITDENFKTRYVLKPDFVEIQQPGGTETFIYTHFYIRYVKFGTSDVIWERKFTSTIAKSPQVKAIANGIIVD